jgi:multicomponent Na+:H+ antiporter subunit D
MPLLDKLRRTRVLDAVALAASLVLLGLSLSLFRAGPGASIYWAGNYGPTTPILGVCLVADGLSRLLLVVVNVVAFLVLLFSGDYMSRYTSRGLYYSLFFLMLAGMNGVVLTGDLFNLYVFIEVASIASYALVAFGCETEELEASFKYLVLGSLSSTIIVFGVAILYGVTGTLNMAQVAQVLAAKPSMPPAALLGLGFFLSGFALKAAMVPFHAWLPDAHPSAPAPISAMLSGVLIKAIGVYVLFRLVFNVFGPSIGIAHVLMALGAVSMVVGVFLAVGQWDFKRLLAYHSISQMGYVVLAVGVGAEVLANKGPSSVANLAIFGGLFHMVNHAAFKSLLFLTSGAIEYATGTRQLKELGGLAGKMPVTSLCTRVASLSIAGVPPFNGFWSKLIIIIAVVQSGHWVLAALTVLVSFMTLMSFVKVQRYALHGKTSERTASAKEVPAGMTVPMVVLAVLCVVLGVGACFYAPAKEMIFDPAQDAMTQGTDYYKGFNLPGLK